MSNKENLSEKNQSVNLSFDEIAERVKEQIDYDCFSFTELMQVTEVVYIITELHTMYPQDKLRIGGELKTVSAVSDIYTRLTHEHVKYVLNNFNKIPYFIHNKKAYLRTALYNSAFELECAEKNLWSATQGDGR